MRKIDTVAVGPQTPAWIKVGTSPDLSVWTIRTAFQFSDQQSRLSARKCMCTTGCSRPSDHIFGSRPPNRVASGRKVNKAQLLSLGRAASNSFLRNLSCVASHSRVIGKTEAETRSLIERFLHAISMCGTGHVACVEMASTNPSRLVWTPSREKTGQVEQRKHGEPRWMATEFVRRCVK